MAFLRPPAVPLLIPQSRILDNALISYLAALAKGFFPPKRPVIASCRINSPTAVRVRQNLPMSMSEAKRGFQSVMSSPSSRVFAPKLSYKMPNFVQMAEDKFGLTSDNGNFWEVHNNFRGSDACSQSTIEVGENGSKKRIVIDAFTGLEQGDEGQVYYILGFHSCKGGPGLSPSDLNALCNEKNLHYMVVNAKRFACLIQNYRDEDAMEKCKVLDMPTQVDDSLAVK